MSCGVGSLSLAHPVLHGSGTFDAIAARRTFGDSLLEDFPFSAFVSKTITPEPRVGNPPPRLFETPSGMINSIGLPNKGLEGFLASDLPELADQTELPLMVHVADPPPTVPRILAALKKGDIVSVECTYENDTGASVIYCSLLEF